MRKIIAIACVLLSACNTSSLRNGPVLTSNEVRTYMTQSCRVPQGQEYSAYDFYVAGVGAARLQCDSYMLALVNANRDARFAANSIATANSQTALILAATTVDPVSSIAVIAAASEFVRQIILGYGNEYAFAAFAQEIYPQLQNLMTSYLENPSTVDLIDEIERDRYSLASYCKASNLVRTFASICSPVSIDSNVRSAISTAKAQEVGTTPASAPSQPRAAKATRSFIEPPPSSSPRRRSSNPLALPMYKLGG